MKAKPEICLRKGCGKPRKKGSDLCLAHTRKYYDRWTREADFPDYGCGGGRRTPRVTGEGSYGGSLHEQQHIGDEDGN
jgi:hypothetical protein